MPYIAKANEPTSLVGYQKLLATYDECFEKIEAQLKK